MLKSVLRVLVQDFRFEISVFQPNCKVKNSAALVADSEKQQSGCRF